MRIYKVEKQDGLEDALKNNRLACSATFEAVRSAVDVDDLSDAVKQHIKATASVGDEDLFWFRSILASTGWNKNNDVFLPEELWAARATATDKKIDDLHLDDVVVGHITASEVIADDRSPIPDTSDVEDLPDLFHVVTSSVLYRVWSDEKKHKYVNEKLIAGLQEGKKSVSMECIFSSFDYALMDDEGNQEIIPRTRETAHLSKYLRVYNAKANNTYNGKKIGRVPRNFIFSGKGVVDDPANPYSVVLEADAATTNIKIKSKKATASTDIEQKNLDLGYLTSDHENQELNVTPEEFTKAIAEANAKVAALAKELDDTKNGNVIKEKEAAIAALTKSVEDANAKAKILNDQVIEMTKKLDEANTSYQAVAGKLATIETEKKQAERVAFIAKELAIEVDAAKAFADKFAKLDDETFNTAVAASVAAAGVKKPTGVTGLPTPMGGEPKKVTLAQAAKTALEDVVVDDSKKDQAVATVAIDAPGKKVQDDIIKYWLSK